MKKSLFFFSLLFIIFIQSCCITANCPGLSDGKEVEKENINS